MKLILFILLTISYSICFAEDRQRKIDSLVTIIGEHHREDSTKVNLLNSLSTEFYEMDKYDSAEMVIIQARLLADRIGFQSGKAFALRRMGAIYTETGSYPQALELLLQSLHIYESLKDNQGIFMVNNNIGTVYYFQQDYQKALHYYGQSYNYKPDDALTCANIGMVHIDKENYPLALQYYLKALKYYKSISNINGISLTLNNIGAVYEGENKNDSALVYYFRALQLKEQIKDYQGKCDALGSIGDIYFKQGKYSPALQYQNKSLTLSKKIGYANGIKLTEQALSELYGKLNQPAKAFEHYKNFIAIRDSMFNEEATKQTVRSEMNFHFQKEQDKIKMEQDKKDAVQNEILKRRQVWIIAFSSGFVLILVFSFFLFMNYKKIRKAKNIIAVQNELLEHQKKEVTDSINYAQRIQQAILPSQEYLRENFQDSFIFYSPKDIVSGDFYWSYQDATGRYVAVADCTGHGVPGAMMSMIGASLLNEIIIERHIIRPDLILNTLREEIIKALNKQGASEERKDGMDITLYKLTSARYLECACANNPLYIVRNKEVIEIKADRFPVGKYVNDTPFTLHTFDLEMNDVIYSFSDGFIDQFGGDKGKKLMSKRFKEWISELSSIGNLQQTKNELQSRFNKWIGTGEQIDDVTIMAVKI